MAALAAVGVIGTITTGASANLLANPGFEDPITFDGPPFVGSWEGFNGGAPAISGNATLMPRSGAQHLELVLASAFNFAGAFQDVVVTAGDPVNFSVYAKDLLGTNGAGVEMRLEYRNSVSNTEVSRTPNLVPGSLGMDYELISLNGTVPAGADLVRAVFAIQSFGGVVNQSIYVDDASFVIPEPASLALVSMAGAMMLRRRR
jgi:hypothetical protein